MLIAALIVHQLKSEETDQEVELICPDGWIAYQVHYYACAYLPPYPNQLVPIKNCSTCLTCKRNSIIYHYFGTVELCVLYRPEIMTSKTYQLWPHKCICHELYFQPFCGMSLTVSNEIITSETFLPCENNNHEIQDNSQSIELVCPKSSSFKTLFERNAAYFNQNQQQINARSFCLTCDHNSATGIHGKELKITMCSPHFYPDENKIYQVTTKNLPECHQQDTSICEPDTIPQIQKGLHCGSKFTWSRSQNSVNISNYILCNNAKTNTQVMLNILY